MMQRIFQFLNKQTSGLHKAAYLLGGFALVSQVLALVRDRMLAHFFGAGLSLDLYYAAFRIPDFIFIFIASLVSLAVLVPLLSRQIEEGEEKMQKTLSIVFTFFFMSVIVVSVITFFLIPILMPFIFPGFEGSYDAVNTMARILLLSPILLGLSNLFSSVTQVYDRFFLYSLSPILYNIGIIIGIIFFQPVWGIVGVVWGVILGAFLHWIIQIPFVKSKGLMPQFTFMDMKVIGKVVATSLPRTFTLGIHHITLIFLIAFASLMAVGSITVFNFSYNLQSVPLAIVGVSYSLAAFPTLSKLFAAGELDQFIDNIVNALRHIIFWSLPIAGLFIVLRAQIVRTVLGSGAFSWDATRLTAAAVALFVIALVFQSVSLLLIRAYYAAGNTSKPLIAGAIGGLIVVLSAFFFIDAFRSVPAFANTIENALRVVGVSGTEVLMLPLGFALGAIVQSLILWEFFRRDFSGVAEGCKSLWKSLFGAIVASVVAYFGLRVLDGVFDLNTLIGVFSQGFLAGIAGILAGILVLWLLGSEELLQVLSVIRRKISRGKIIGPDSEVI